MKLKVRDKKTGKVHDVWKYIKNADGEIHIWCNTWYGHHIIGQDCEFETEQSSPDGLTIADYEEVLKDHRMVVREIDVIINGKSAALQASLIDLVGQIQELKDAPDAKPLIEALEICQSENVRITTILEAIVKFYEIDKRHGLLLSALKMAKEFIEKKRTPPTNSPIK